MNEELIRQRWLWIKEHIRNEYRLSNISYTTWIENLEIADIKDHTVYVRIPSDKPIMLDYIVNNYKVTRIHIRQHKSCMLIKFRNTVCSKAQQSVYIARQ